MKNTSKFQNVVIVTIVGWLVLFVFLPQPDDHWHQLSDP
ncbi:spermidine/putrescine ABC transporter membrane protein [Salmonella enterica subsp. enterica]|nr:spermidine/putrescine ABC transporter membrane protein [Salmonella enterica subsp. enterica]